LRSHDGSYAAAPQVFYFRPQRKWFLIFQTTDSYYQPVYSTTATIDRPESWTKPEKLVEKQESAKWIDFWLICDDKLAYLFFTRSHKKYMMLVETSPDRKMRRYGMATAVSLGGPWSPASDFASGPQLRYEPGAEVWTDEVSHGELIRTGYDERLAADPARFEFLIQGMPAPEHQGDYPSWPWRLGLITKDSAK